MKRNAITLICMALVALAVFAPVQLAGMMNPSRPISDVAIDHADNTNSQGPQSSQGAQTDVSEDASEGLDVVSSAVTSDNSSTEPEYISGEIVVGLSDGVTIDQLNARLAELDYVATKSVSESDVAFGYVKLELAQDVDVSDAMGRISNESVVASAEPNYVLHIMEESPLDVDYASAVLQAGGVPDGSLTAQSTTLNDPFGDNEANLWPLKAVHAFEAWDYMRTENAQTPVTVAVIDSGLRTDNEDFESSRIVGAKSYVHTSDDTDVSDGNGHGTHVTGIIAATANNNKGIAGVSYNAQVMPVQIIDSVGNTGVDKLLLALQYVVDNAETYNVRVVNISIGSQEDWSGSAAPAGFAEAIQAVHEKGILIVYAAGNYYEKYNAYDSFPCDFDSTPGSIGVIAVQPDSESTDGFVRASYSNCNKSGSETRTKDLSAPGGANSGSTSNMIYSTQGTGYRYLSGTSMAAPYVSGIAAMLFAADPTLTATDVETILETNVTQLGNNGWDDDTGYGLVNAETALKATSTVSNSNPVMSGPETVGKTDMATFSISNSGSRTWTWTSSDDSIATVVAGSDTSGATVTGVAKGTVTIKATSSDYIELTQDTEVVDAAISGPSEIERGTSSSLAVDGGYSIDEWTWSCSPETGLILNEGEDAVTVTGVNAGEYTVTATYKADTDYAISRTITVTPTNISTATISGVSNQTYTGGPITFSGLTVTLESGGDATTLTENTDYTVAYSNNTDAGTGTVIVSGIGNYKGSKTVTFNIAQANLESIVLSQTSHDYSGSACNPSSVKVYGPKSGHAGQELAVNTDYTLEIPSGRKMPGTYTYKAAGKGNYTGTVSATMTVKEVPVQSVSLSTSSYAYDGYQKSPAITVKDANGRTMIEGTDYTLATPSGRMAVGSYTYTVTPKGAYSGSPLTATMQITTASLANATVTVSPTSCAYDGNPKTPAVTVRVNGHKLSKGNDYTVAYSNNVNAGTGMVTVTGKGNYTGSQTATFKILMSSASGSSSSSSSSSTSSTTTVSASSAAHRVQYNTHVQNVGWQSYVTDGATSGTSGRGLRLEGIHISLKDHPYSGSIQYRTHIQNIGWESNWKSDGAMSGTSGRSLRLEAIQIRLTGEMAQKYDVYYRVHAQNFGWLGWAKNGAQAGTAGYSYRLEAIQIKLVPKGSSAPGSTTGAFRNSSGAQSGVPDFESYVFYRTHVQNDGWQNYMRDGEMSGTSGRSLRLEGINIKLGGAAGSGGIEYRTHVQNIGWQGWKSNGTMSGTSGRSLRLEAIQIRLTGAAAQKYDIYYRVHAQNFGWMGWAKNGASAGTAGYSYRLEAIQIRLVPKGGAAPGSTAGAFRSR